MGGGSFLGAGVRGGFGWGKGWGGGPGSGNCVLFPLGSGLES